MQQHPPGDCRSVSSPTVPDIQALTPTRLAVIADPHLATDASGTWKCYHRTEAFLERAVDEVRSREPDGIVVAGDLTKDGEPHNFRRYDELVDPLGSVVTIPGNHDVPKSYVDHVVPSIESFAARYTETGYPFRRRIGDVDLLCLNSATMPDSSLRDTWGGRLSESQLDWLASTLSETTTSIVVLHHNLFAQPEHDDEFGENFRLSNSEQLLDILSENAPVLVISGHHHIPSFHHERGVTELIAPALCSYPSSYLEIEIGLNGTTVSRLPIATPAEEAELYTLGTTGSPLGRKVVEVAAERLRVDPFQ